jgi:hypothetical protein
MASVVCPLSHNPDSAKQVMSRAYLTALVINDA